MNLKQVALRGGVINLIAQAVNASLRIVVIIVFAHLLDPEDFGIMAMVTATFGILTLFKDMGLSAATIQRGNVTQEQLSAMFWINTGVGTLLALITLLSSWAVAAFYRESRLVELTAAFSLTFLVSAIGIQHGALMQRQMRFPALAFVDTSSLLGGILIGLASAYAGAGYWSLLTMELGRVSLNSIMLWALSGWRPGMPRRASGMRSLLMTGGIVTTNGIVMHLAHNLDKLLIGRFFGAEVVGLYSRAQTLANFPTDVINSAVGRVLLSTFSRVKTDRELIRSYFMMAYRLLVSVTVPVATAMAFLAEDIVGLLLGEKWMSAAPIFRWLMPSVLAFALLSPFYQLLLALDLTARSLRMALVIGPIMMVSYVIGMQWGALGAAAGLSAGLVAWFVPHLAWSVHGTPVTLTEALKAIGLPLLASAAAGACGLMALSTWGEGDTHGIRLLIALPVFTAVYAFLLLVVMGQWRLFRSVIQTLLSRRRATAAPNES
jgi:PST family polysaccharide transporter